MWIDGDFVQETLFRFGLLFLRDLGIFLSGVSVWVDDLVLERVIGTYSFRPLIPGLSSVSA
jgi:hypothetical protein